MRPSLAGWGAPLENHLNALSIALGLLIHQSRRQISVTAAAQGFLQDRLPR